MEVWRVNARTQELKREGTPEAWSRPGGRGLIARIMVDEVDAKGDPLGPANKLSFAPGLLVGHTAGLTIRAQNNHLDPNVQVDTSRTTQLKMGGYDSLGACIFAGSGHAATPDPVVKRLLTARYGWQEAPDNILQQPGKETIRLEREFNRRAGFTEKDDRLPGWMTKEALPENQSVFDVKAEDLDNIFRAFEPVHNEGK